LSGWCDEKLKCTLISVSFTSPVFKPDVEMLTNMHRPQAKSSFYSEGDNTQTNVTLSKMAVGKWTTLTEET